MRSPQVKWQARAPGPLLTVRRHMRSRWSGWMADRRKITDPDRRAPRATRNLRGVGYGLDVHGPLLPEGGGHGGDYSVFQFSTSSSGRRVGAGRFRFGRGASNSLSGLNAGALWLHVVRKRSVWVLVSHRPDRGVRINRAGSSSCERRGRPTLLLKIRVSVVRFRPWPPLSRHPSRLVAQHDCRPIRLLHGQRAAVFPGMYGSGVPTGIGGSFRSEA
jgi:hypothetical protein